MNAKDFKTLTGEDPEDVLGGDWQETITDLEEPMPKDHQNRCAGCAKCEP